MLLGYADIEGAVGKCLGKFVDARAAWHSGRNCDDTFIAFSLLDQCFGENICIAWRSRGPLFLFAGDNIEFRYTVILVA